MALRYQKIFLCFLSLVFLSVVCGEISTGNALWALEFGGKSFVKLPYDFSFDLNPTFTFEAWINSPHPNDDTYKPIVSRGTGTHNKDTDFVLLIGKEGGLTFLMGNGAVSSEYGLLIQAGFLQPNTWYHLAFSVMTKRYESNPSMAVLYLNGRRAGESSWGSGARQLHPERSILLGSFGNQEGIHYFTGLMDEIRFWDEERTQLNLRKYLNFPLLGNENNLRVYYDCNTKHSSSLLDRTVHHYDGQITQGPFAVQWVPSTLKLHFAEYVWRRGKRSVEEEREGEGEGEGEVNEGEGEMQQVGAQAQQRRMRKRQQRQQRQQPDARTLTLRSNKSPFPLNNFTYIIESLPELGNIAVGYNNRIIRSTDLPYPLDYPSVQYLIPEGESGVTFFRFYGMERATREGDGVVREKESTVYYLKVGEPSVCSDKDGCAEKCKA